LKIQLKEKKKICFQESFFFLQILIFFFSEKMFSVRFKLKFLVWLVSFKICCLF